MPSIRFSRAVRRVALVASVGFLPATSAGQIYDPVQWELEFDAATAPPGGTVLARLTATIQEGWHVYSTTTPEGIALSLQLAESEAVDSWTAYQPEPQIVYDPNFQADVEWYTKEVVFLYELALAADATGDYTIEAQTRYGACDDRQCLPPKRKNASARLAIRADAVATSQAVPAGYQAVTQASAGTGPANQGDPPSASGSGNLASEFKAESQGIVGFSLLALGFGFAAILTPCVFPMIPIYLGSFMSGGDRPWGAVLRQAGLFCLGVIVLFTAFGGALSAFLGPFGLSQIGSNVWVNLLIAGVLFAFALSMLGAFEIVVPSSWTTGASARSVGSGIAATLMLSLVFTLASFACTGPFIGTLLATSAISGSLAFPVLGMTMFSTGLSAPFFVLALFPALADRLPRSGGWLAMTKRTAGFVILAVGLKYLGHVDQVFGWELLTRERFLAIWTVLFSLAGLYLWGVVRLSDDQASERIGLPRLGSGTVFMALAISLIPGMFGGHLGELEAHVPAASSAAFSSAGQDGLAWIKDDYEGALAEARNSGHPLLISFTGYACSNCKWMKANMFTKPEIRELLQDVVLTELYTDGLEEIHEQHQRLQIETFRSSTIPFYAVLRPDGSVAATFSGQTRDVEEFRGFLMSYR